MWGAWLLGVLLAAAPADEESRTIRVTIVDEAGRPVAGLDPSEVAVVENGVARVVLGITPEDRPMNLALIVDTSMATRAALKLSVAPGLSEFVAGLPAGANLALWTTGDRPIKALDYTVDRSAAQRAVARLFPIGGNTLLDALVEASAELKKKEGERSVVVAVTGLDPDFSHRDRWQSLDQAEKNAELFLAVAYDEGGTDFEDRQKYDFVLAGLADRSGGRYETVLTAMAVAGALQKVLAEIKGQYRLTYAAGPEVKEKNRKLEVKVARPGIKTRLAKGKAS